jgi:hypothetical protein
MGEVVRRTTKDIESRGGSRLLHRMARGDDGVPVPIRWRTCTGDSNLPMALEQSRNYHKMCLAHRVPASWSHRATSRRRRSGRVLRLPLRRCAERGPASLPWEGHSSVAVSDGICRNIRFSRTPRRGSSATTMLAAIPIMTPTKAPPASHSCNRYSKCTRAVHSPKSRRHDWVEQRRSRPTCGRLKGRSFSGRRL